MSVRRAPCSLRDATLIILGLPCVLRALPCSATLCCALARYTLRSLSRLAAMAEVWEHGGVLCFQTFSGPVKTVFSKATTRANSEECCVSSHGCIFARV